MTNEIGIISEEALPATARALANAFFKDPLQNYTFPDDVERREKSPAHFAAALNYGLKFGEVYAAGNGAGASIWLKPGETEITDDRADAAGFTQLPDQIGAEAFGRFFSVIAFGDKYHKEDAPEPHWYTMVLGVDPGFQGQGYGRALLQPVIDKAKESNTPIYLETAQPENVAFYRKMGFDLLRELIEPESGLKMWTFRREP